MARARRKRREERTIRLVRPAGLDGLAVVRIDAGPSVEHYVVREIGCEIGGRGFVVQKLGLGSLYHVRIGQPSDCSCECMGFLSRTVCRHVLGLLALERAGVL